jgi:hypothetical protein
LEYYKYILPYLVPDDGRYVGGHLWHPDLHAANLFVVPSGPATEDGKIQANITSFIDWQGAWVGPAFLQLTVPVIPHLLPIILRLHSRRQSRQDILGDPTFHMIGWDSDSAPSPSSPPLGEELLVTAEGKRGPCSFDDMTG